MGLLTVYGLIELDQFWPIGQSDADTTKVKARRFVYQNRRTKIFHGAAVHAMGRSRLVIDRKGHLTVRYQGIDAPELHFQPRSPRRRSARDCDFRQYAGESATMALRAYLQEIAGKAGDLACEVRTRVEHPDDVFDAYGRFVGDVWVGGVHLNRWLVREGWAFPSFYASMMQEEIRTLLEAGEHAARKKTNIWSSFSDELAFDPSLLYRRPTNDGPVAIETARDRRPITMPKIFRRLATCYVMHGEVGRSALTSYFARRASQDWCYSTREFLEQGAAASTPHRLADLVRGHRFVKRPADIVFKEQPSRIVGADGRAIRSWS